MKYTGPDLRRAHPQDAGLDLTLQRSVELAPGDYALVDTGICVDIPAGHVGLVCPRSGLAAFNGITVLNAPGVIDAGYTGTVCVVLINLDRHLQVLQRGSRIAQLVIVPCLMDAAERVDTLPPSDRGADGFGSTDFARRADVTKAFVRGMRQAMKGAKK